MASFDVTVEVVLVYTLVTAETTFTLNVQVTTGPNVAPVRVTVQLAEAASVAPERLIVPDPATAVAVPPQVEVKPLGVDTTIPAGSVSVKATPVNAANEFGLLTVRLSEEVPPPGTILFGVKVL